MTSSALKTSLALILLSAYGAHAQNFTYTISTVVGTDRLNDGGPATGTLLRGAEAVVKDSAGNVYIADSLDNRVRKVNASGIISTYAGDGYAFFSGDGGRAQSASLDFPAGLALDPTGNLYIADYNNYRVRRVSPGGIIDTVAGSGLSSFSGDGGSALSAGLKPSAIALDSSGNLYIADYFHYRIRKVDKTGTITTIAGTGTTGFSGDGGPALQAAIGYVFSLAVDAQNNIYFSDITNRRIRKIDAAGVVTTVAGNAASIYPSALAVDAAGAVYFTEDFNNQVDKLDPATGGITIVAGSGSSGFAGDGGPAGSAAFNFPYGIFVDSQGIVLVSDESNGRIRQISNGTITTIAGAGPRENGPALSTFLNFPQSVALDHPASGPANLYIADPQNALLRKASSAAGGDVHSVGLFGYSSTTSGVVIGVPVSTAADGNGNVYASTNLNYVVRVDALGQTSILAGSGNPDFTGDEGPAVEASLNEPRGLAVDATGNIFIADYGNSRIRKITPDGIIHSIAGSGDYFTSGDGGPARNAGLSPWAIALDSYGNLFVADPDNSVVRKIDSNGIISTFAGTGNFGSSGDRGPAVAADLGIPVGIAVDSQNAVYIADLGSSVVWRVGSTGYISIIAGDGIFTPASGDGGPALDANLDPEALAVDAAGNVYVVDSFNDLIRKLVPTAITTQSLAIISGQSQSAGTGTPLAAPLKVQIKGSDGLAYFGAPVSFQITSGTASLSAASAITDADGIATVTVTLGSALGPVVVTASAPGLAPVSFNLQAIAVPVLTAGGISGAGLSTPVVSALSPGGIFSIFGAALSSATHSVDASDIVASALPSSLLGTCVEVGGQRAPLFYISPTQINAQVPGVAPGSAVAVDVITGCDTPSPARSATLTVTVQAASPEFFYFGHTSDSKGVVAAVNAVTGALIGPAGIIAGVTTIPAKPDDIVTLFGTGFGSVNPILAPGFLAAGAASVTAPVTIKLGGVTLAPADVLYVGAAPGFAGLYQVNLRVPLGTPPTAQSLVINIGGVDSPGSAILQIGN